MEDRLRELKAESKILKPIIIVGKNGFTDEVIENIKKELLKRYLIKIKVLGSFMDGKDKKEVIDDVVKRTNSRLVDLVGFTFVLARK